ncbi:hypothetical protein ACOT81_01805 [Streptomyces sp. WI04-05B]|uniref:hypothetical protein n=1 Tax=Streptomyces TaxID=1883 RepID=UPI0029AC363C|nr:MULTISPECIES: hypothetical protein [unclassified Streptomyces]MDX2541644.1 hypothetical protein [Streptomyces sp. WI04-05B]MDX2583622.1 hypothetical protein [Streptomyces sp. WI04-05A]
MDTLTTAGPLLASAAEGETLFLGEDLVGWRTALIAAVAAAIAYELAMTVTRRVTLRLPFLILYLTRIGMSHEAWKRLHREWVAELHSVLSDCGAPWTKQFLGGLRFTVPLALGGASRTARADAEISPRRRLAAQPRPDYTLARLAGVLCGCILVLVAWSLPLSAPVQGSLLIGFGLAPLLVWGSMYAVLRFKLRRRFHARDPRHEPERNV